VIKTFIKKYGIYMVVPVYTVLYLLAFHLLESRTAHGFHVIHASMDSSIPFCEYFIVPYLLWFFFIAATVLWFMFKDKEKKEYTRLIINLGIGMTLFILISWIYPNGHFLRPEVFPRENIFTDMVRALYGADTSTNIFPSIHVYNSVAAFIAIAHNETLRKKKVVVPGAFVLTVLIILSTVFLKQHTVVDVIGAFALNFVVYILVYRIGDNRVTVNNKAYSKAEHS